MSDATAAPQGSPRLLKKRMFHTRALIALLVPYLLLTDTIYPDGSWMHAGLEWIGYALVIIGAFGRVWCSAYIGGRKNDVLTFHGPYSVVRNPLYVFSFLAVLGIGLQSATFTLTIALIVIFLLYYPGVVAREEAFLLHRFGQAYRDYMARVPRWLPRFSLWESPVEISTRPVFILRTMRDAALFFLPFPLFALQSNLHDTGVMPLLLRLY